MVTEGIATALTLVTYIGVQLPGDMVAHGLTFPFAVYLKRLEPHHHEYDAQRLRSHRVLAQVFMQKCAA